MKYQKRPVKINYLILVFSISLIVCGCISSNQPVPTFPLSREKLVFNITSEKQKYNFDEDIVINCDFTNQSNSTIYFDPPWGWYTSVYLYLKEKKQPINLTDKYLVEYEPVGSKSEIIKLEPKDTYRYKRIFRLKYYNFKKVSGVYNFYIVYENHSRWVPDIPSWIGELNSNTVTFELY